MDNKIIKSTFILTFSILISKILGAIYRIPLSNILGAEGMGLYQMVFPLYSILLVAFTGGVSIYLSQKVSNYRAENNKFLIGITLKTCKNTGLVYGIIAASMLCGLSYFIASIQGDETASIGYVAIGFSFMFSCVSGVYRGYFQGYENMFPNAVAQILEQSIKLTFGLIFSFILLKNGVVWGVFGALLGVSISEIICYLFFEIYFRKHTDYNKNNYFIYNYKDIIKDIVPLCIFSIMLPMISLIDSLFSVRLMMLSGLNQQEAVSLFGIYSGMINPILNFPIVILSALMIALLPNLSYKLKKKIDIKPLLNNALKYIFIFAFPCILGLMVVSDYVFKILFPIVEKSYLNISVITMQISSLNILFLSLISFCSCVLQSYGKYKKSCIGLGVAIIIKLLISFIILLNKNINIIGISLINLIVYLIAFLINFSYLKKESKLKINFKNWFFPLFSAFLMSFCLFFIKKVIFFNDFINLIILIFIGFIIYFILILLFKMIDINEIKTMLKKNTKIDK